MDYTYQDSEHPFFYINLLNQDCVWNKQMNTLAWMNVALKGVQSGMQNTCRGNPNDITSPQFGCFSVSFQASKTRTKQVVEMVCKLNGIS